LKDFWFLIRYSFVRYLFVNSLVDSLSTVNCQLSI